MFKNVIFDWSGVVKDVSESHFMVVKKMFEALGNKEMSLAEIKRNYDEPYMEFWHRFFPELTIEEEQGLYRKELMDKDHPAPAPYGDIVELIKKIKKSGIRITVLSSDFPETILPEVKKFGLEGIFDEVVPFAHDKSDAIHGLIERNGFNRKETVFIGDSSNEIKAGKSAGVKTIGVTWGVFSEEKLRASDFLAHNLKELEEILLL